LKSSKKTKQSSLTDFFKKDSWETYVLRTTKGKTNYLYSFLK
jgi:hypothetical protein